jgi:hypothetical protein
MKKRFFISVCFVLALSFFGWAMWISEIYFLKGWPGLQWLNGFMFSSVPATLCAVIAFLFPLHFSKPKSERKDIFVAIVTLFAVSFICFFVGRYTNYILFSRFGLFFIVGPLDKVGLLACLILVILFHGIIYIFITNRLIQKTKKLNVLLTFFVIPFAFFLSMVSVRYFPGFGNSNGWIDAIKMGYPVFWTIFLMGLSGSLIAIQGSHQKIQ